MGALGMLFAIDPRQLRRLESARGDDDLMAVVEDIEEAWDEDHLLELDKSWDALHRALTDGALALDSGSFPLSHAILGGQSLHAGEDYVVSLKRPGEVDAIAVALSAMSDETLLQRYDTMVPPDYDPSYGPEDREYTLGGFRDLVRFYQRARAAGRAVIFTVDQ